MRAGPRVVGAVATVLVVVIATRAAADPAPLPAPANTSLTWYHVETPGHLVTEGGTDLRLPPGYYLPEPVWRALDTEVRRLQDQETRLTAENASLTESATGWQPGWKTLGLAVLSGVALGAYLEHRL